MRRLTGLAYSRSLRDAAPMSKENEEKAMNRFDRNYMERKYHLSWGEGWRRSPIYGLPILEKEIYVPERLVLFEKISRALDKSGCVIFNQSDKKIDPFWNSPERYFDALRRFDCVTTPDFSLLLDMPRPFIEANVLRSLMLGRKMQELGFRVLANVMWAHPDTYDFCFEALPRNSILFVSSVGCLRNKISRECLADGLRALMERVRPPGIVLYGPMPNLNFEIPVVRHFERLSPICRGGYQSSMF